MSSPGISSHRGSRQALAWGVHLLTASGAVLGTFAILLIQRGELATAALLMLLNLAIDSVDGTLARAVGVSKVLPHVNGRRLDDIVDYLNFVVVPMMFMIEAGSLLHWAWIIPPLLASAYGFAQEDAKTDDDFFVGWPSYWNVVAFYLWLLELSPAAGTAWVGLFAIAVFVPIKYIYPSKLKKLKRTSLVGGCLWGLAVAASVIAPEWAKQIWLVELSLLYPAYYVALSLWMGGLQHRASARF